MHSSVHYHKLFYNILKYIQMEDHRDKIGTVTRLKTSLSSEAEGWRATQASSK